MKKRFLVAVALALFSLLSVAGGLAAVSAMAESPAAPVPTPTPVQERPALLAPTPAPLLEAAASAPAMPRYITVVGRGKASVEPDIVILQVGVETKAPEVTQAMDNNDEIMGEILAALDEMGIAEEDIRTTNYRIYFDEGYRSPEMQEEPVYRVSNMVMVTIRDLGAAGEILDEAVAAGANRVHGLSFTKEDWSEAEAEARAEAMANARERAEHLAQLADVEVGQVISISEVVGDGLQWYERTRGTPLAMMGGSGGPIIAPGQLEYGVTIQVTYALK